MFSSFTGTDKSGIKHASSMLTATAMTTDTDSDLVSLGDGPDAELANTGEVSGQCDDPMRADVNMDFFVGGEEYFSAAADAMENAKKSIMIAGWAMSPQMYLKRGTRSRPLAGTSRQHQLPQQYRLDLLLQSKAQMGVQVYIILWRDKLRLGSQCTKEYMRDLHPNIRVIRHGPSIDKAFWSHHEKYVIVDAEYAFIGGLDFFHGRWDTWTHPLTDIKHPQTWQGCDYYNPSAPESDSYTLQNHKSPMKDKLDRMSVARMPWQDVAVRVNGSVVSDLTAHFIDRWYQYILGSRKDAVYYALLPQQFNVDYSYNDVFQLEGNICLNLNVDGVTKRILLKGTATRNFDKDLTFSNSLLLDDCTVDADDDGSSFLDSLKAPGFIEVPSDNDPFSRATLRAGSPTDNTVAPEMSMVLESNDGSFEFAGGSFEFASSGSLNRDVRRDVHSNSHLKVPRSRSRSFYFDETGTNATGTTGSKTDRGSFLPSYVPSFLPSCIPSFLPHFLPSFAYSFLTSFLHMFHPSCLPSYIPSFLPSYIPSFLPSYIPSFLPSYTTQPPPPPPPGRLVALRSCKLESC
jgi:hypothetical protein